MLESVCLRVCFCDGRSHGKGGGGGMLVKREVKGTRAWPALEKARPMGGAKEDYSSLVVLGQRSGACQQAVCSWRWLDTVAPILLGLFFFSFLTCPIVALYPIVMEITIMGPKSVYIPSRRMNNLHPSG